MPAMDSLKQKYQSVREEGVRNKAQSIRGDGFRNKAVRFPSPLLLYPTIASLTAVPHQSSLIKGDKAPAQTGYAPRPISELRDPSSYGPPPRRTTDPRGQIEPPPPPYRSSTSSSTSSRAPPPSLPPRLPPRRDSPAQDPYINQGAASRLGASGISVPDLGISPSTSREQGESQGTSWEQKKSALRTANNFHRDPGSVSLADARSTASTANNFRERHGATVARGAQTASDLNQRYGISERASSAGRTGAGMAASGAGAAASALGGLAGKKKPPPPPPPKKGSLSTKNSAGDEPPPLPMSTKPRF